MQSHFSETPDQFWAEKSVIDVLFDPVWVPFGLVEVGEVWNHIIGVVAFMEHYSSSDG